MMTKINFRLFVRLRTIPSYEIREPIWIIILRKYYHLMCWKVTYNVCCWLSCDATIFILSVTNINIIIILVTL
jgi:hypothetical protein